MSGVDYPQRLVATISRRLSWQGWIANAIGAAVVFLAIGFLLAIFFSADTRDELGRRNLPVVIASVVLLGLPMRVAFKRRLERAVGWVLERREPTDEEHRLTLKLPAFTALLTGAGWAAGAAISALFNLDQPAGTVAVIVGSIWLGGETTSALAYLVSERTLRPITALALAARESEGSVAPGVRDRLLFAWSLGTGVPMLGVLVVSVAGLVKPGVEAEYVAGAGVFLGAVAIAVGLLVTVITAQSIADPLTSMREAMERIRGGDFEASVAVDDASEVGRMQAEFNRMAEGLRERERIRDLFGRQVGRHIAREALRRGVRLGGEEREIGAVFVDLVGSTSMALAMPPTEVVRLLNRFFRVVIEVVETEDGLVNKFEGDAALCVFGAPADHEDPAGAALRAARLLAARLQAEVPEVGFGIGISAGSAVAGNVGSEQRFEYTVIGDPVNEAARLCELAKERPEPVLAAEAALERASEAEREAWEVGERTVLRGRLEATGLASPRA